MRPDSNDRWPNLGLLALVVSAGGLLSGLFLALNFAPTLDAAHDSVAYIENQVALGRFLRGLHHWSGTLALSLAALHGLRLFWNGGYKRPRRALWVLGSLLLLVLVGFAYTGYLLPGDERAITGMGVMAGVAGSTPIVGEAASKLARGGDVVSSATLTRLYVMHTMLLPGALLCLLGAFLAFWRKTDGARRDFGINLARNAAGAAAVLVLLALLAWLLPPALGPKADPTGSGSPDAKPEWFFLWINELLFLLPRAKFLVGAVLPGVLVAAAIGLPWIRPGKEARPAHRRGEIAVAAAIVVCIAGLTIGSLAAHARAEQAEEGSAATTAEPAADLGFEERATMLLKKFRCTSCHRIDGAEAPDEAGPPLDRKATADLPAFSDLYSRAFFRLKVADPAKFWADTGMHYTPKRLRPKPAELKTLERWFYGD